MTDTRDQTVEINGLGDKQTLRFRPSTDNAGVCLFAYDNEGLTLIRLSRANARKLAYALLSQTEEG